MFDKYKNTIKSFIILLWFIIVLICFFKHFPIKNLYEITLNVFALFIILLFFTSLGRYTLKHFHFKWNSFAEECCFSFGIGSGVFILLIISLAYLKILYEILIVSLFLILFIVVYKDTKYFIMKGRNELFLFLPSKKSPFEKVLISFIFIFIISTLLSTLTPPFFYDALSYHLAVPSQYLFNHGFLFLPLNDFSNFPANLGMLFILAFSLSGDLLAKLISWVYAPIIGLAVYSCAKSLWGKHIGILSAAIVIFVPGIMILSTLTSIDLAVTFYSFMSLYALLYWFKFTQRRWFILAGIFCGFAVGTKYTAILVTWTTLEIILFVHVYLAEKKPFMNGLKHCSYFGLIVLFCFSPWLIKNIIYTKNPLYPFSFSLSKSSSPESNNYSQVMIRGGNPIHSWLYKFKNNDGSLSEGIRLILSSPWKVTMTTNGAAGKTGIIFLLGLPCIFLIKKIPLFIRYLFFFSGSVFLLWILLLPWLLRYAFPMFPSLSILVAYIFYQLSEYSRGRKWIITGISTILIYNLFLFYSEMVSVLHPFSYFFGNQSKEEFLVSHGINYYPVIQWANKTIPTNSKILFVGELRGYYCERDYLLHVGIENTDESKLILRNLIKESKSIDELLHKLKKLEITHILINFTEMSRLAKNYFSLNSDFDFTDNEKNALVQDFFSDYLTPLASKNKVTLYKINYPEDTPK
jgi:4-amino-4-deoxy-L-arabinose transferase-like glycosyltransferase